MPTSWTPRLGRFPLSFGLFMSGFSGHAVVPSLYRDMKSALTCLLSSFFYLPSFVRSLTNKRRQAEPRHFGSMAAVAFSVAFVVSLIFAVLGYLMFVLSLPLLPLLLPPPLTLPPPPLPPPNRHNTGSATPSPPK